MSHIATEKFFKEKKSSIQNLANNNFTIIEEGVGTGSTDSNSQINALMGYDFTSL